MLSGRVIDVEEAERIGLVTEVVPPGDHVERALAMAEAIAAFPQDTMLSDRRAAARRRGPAARARASRSRRSSAAAATAPRSRGRERFAGGEGRGGAGTGI